MAKTWAFDAHRPPDQQLVDVCVHCGFCLPACPTYVPWNEEMDSPRGRIVLMNVALEEPGQLSDAMVTHWDHCLGYMACVTSCPSGVEYNKLIEATKPQVERNYKRPFDERAFKRFAFAVFSHPGRLRALVPVAVAARRLGLAGKGEGRLERFPRLRALQGLLPDVRLEDAVRSLPEVIPSKASAGGGWIRGLRLRGGQRCGVWVIHEGLRAPAVR
jgi:glycolate oxidase iron-sulfur subunit